MHSIDDSDDAVKKAAKPPETEPMSKPGAEPSLVAPLALRSDGKTLLSVAHLQGVDVTGREQWTGMVLTEDEVGRIRDRLMNAFDEAAGRVGGRLRWDGKKGEDDGNKGGDGE
jgi:hypothetical protein